MSKKLIYLVSVVLVLGLVLTRACEAGDPTLVGYWTFDEGSGTTAFDYSGNNYHGTIATGSEWVTGQLGGALSFKAGGGVNVPPEVWSSIEKYVTLAFWAYGDPDLLPAACNVFQGHDPGGRVVGSHVPWSNGNVYFDAGGDRIYKAATPEEYEGSWQHWTFTKDADAGEQKIYLNGVLWHSGSGLTGTMTGITAFYIGYVAGGATYQGMMDDFQLYNVALTEAEIGQIMQGVRKFALSYNPSPADEATDVRRDVVLSWIPGDYADKHDVYLGTNFDDVNDATTTVDPAGAYLGRQDPNTLALDRLDLGQTYYWRVDEVNAPPDYTVFKGNVWQFTVEPIAYPIAGEKITATASSFSSEGEGPENTINGSGLDADDLHSAENTAMWLSSMIGPQPTWIQYEFDRVYKLHQMWVWNHNSLTELAIGFGVKDATIEYSTDGADWTTLGTTHEFARAPGAAGYAHNTTVDLGGVVAKYIKITANSNWGGLLAQYGLSEVRFLYIPVWAREPDPASGAIDMDVDLILNWRPGREAASHDVYISADEQAVIDETISPVSVPAGSSYASFNAGTLDLSQIYYWKVNEVNEAETPTTWQGDVWNFGTQEYLVVENFEDYNDFEPDRIFDTWIDGWADPTKGGSQVGYPAPPFAEQTIARGGGQSMPLIYDNTTAGYSEATVNVANLPIGQDWSKSGIKALTLWFYGDPGNAAEQMYVKLNGSKVAYDGDADNITRIPWQPWNIDLATFGVDLSNVTELSIGFERSGAAGGSGMVLFDDIRLYPFERQLITPAEPNTANLMAHYAFEGNFQDSSGNGYHGSPIDNVVIVSDPIRGQVASFDGDWDAVDVPLIGTSNEITFAMWVYIEDPSRPFNSCFNGTGWEDGDFHFKVERGVVIGHLFGLSRAVGTAVLQANQWNHLVGTLSTTDTAVWLNGRLEASLAHPADLETAPTVTLGDGVIGAWRKGDDMIDRELLGKVDDVLIYDRALTQEEIAWLAGRTKAFDKPF